MGEINSEESYNYVSASQLYCKFGNFVACILAILRFLSIALAKEPFSAHISLSTE